MEDTETIEVSEKLIRLICEPSDEMIAEGAYVISERRESLDTRDLARMVYIEMARLLPLIARRRRASR